MIKRHLISMGVTFVGFFLLTFGAALLSDTFVFNQSAITAIAISATIAGFRGIAKLIYELGRELIAKYNK